MVSLFVMELNSAWIRQAARQHAARLSADALVTGTVFDKLQGTYWVDVDGLRVPCSISSRLRKVLIYPVADVSSLHARVQEVADIRMVDPVAVGDLVNFHDAGDGSGVILEIHERSSALVRRAAGAKPLQQVIVANVDQVVCVVAAALPAPSWELLDRYLAACEANELPALICITKMDVANRAAIEAELEVYRGIGYAALTTSAATGEGIRELGEQLAGRTSVFAGKSGVGKTSLLNEMQPGLGLRVNEVSGKTGKGYTLRRTWRCSASTTAAASPTRRACANSHYGASASVRLPSCSASSGRISASVALALAQPFARAGLRDQGSGGRRRNQRAALPELP